MISAPAAPGSLNSAPSAQQMLDYLGRLDAWLAERRGELDTLDAQILATDRQAELTADMALAMALWQAAKARQNLLLATWDSGRVAAQELQRLAALIWGRLDTAGSQVASLQSMAVSLPEAGRLCDALVAQLRTRLNTDPNATALQLRLTDLRAQAERLRDQLMLEPPALAPAGQARLSAINARIVELANKLSRGGDINGTLSALEVEAATFERDLIVGGARRREARELLERVRAAHAALLAREQAVRTLATQVNAAVWPSITEAVPSVTELGPIPNTAAALTSYEASVQRLSLRLSAVQEQLQRRLGERDAAQAQLATLTAKASTFGDDPVLASLADQIQTRLAEAPVALPTVQQLLGALSAELDYRAQRSR